MNRPHFRRRPRPTDPDPYTRLDHLDGLPGRTRYDAEWPDVIAAEWSSLPPVFEPRSFVGGDLAAMAAPADWPPFTGWGEYDIGPWPVAVTIKADTSRFTAAMERIRAALEALDAPPDLPMVRAAATAYDLGLPVPLRSDPPLYRQALAGHVGAGVA